MLTALLMISAQTAPVMIRCPVVQKLEVPGSVARVRQPAPIAKGADAETLQEVERRAPSRLRDARAPRAQAGQPATVSDLVKDEFRETAANSRKQVESYSGLTGDVANSVEKFSAEKPPRASPSDIVPDPRCKALSN